jgi:hypothetical protein
MKTRILFTVVFLLFTVTTVAQNIQLHFDPRHALHKDVFNKNYLTATFEMFKPDKWGSTYGYIDFDFNQSKGNIGSAYIEISRDQKIRTLPVMAHVEFNGGVGSANNFGFSIPNAYLLGVSYTTQVRFVNINIYIAYKYNAFEKVSSDFQWTIRWTTHLFDNKFTISGFLDIYTENYYRFKPVGETNRKKIVLVSEPQFWYNVTSSLSFGTEIEISNNFIAGTNKVYINPTIAAKWNF